MHGQLSSGASNGCRQSFCIGIWRLYFTKTMPVLHISMCVLPWLPVSVATRAAAGQSYGFVAIATFLL
jgi:hypothetical protein